MKNFKKGISLVAVIAFLITAIIPVSGLAADLALPSYTGDTLSLDVDSSGGAGTSASPVAAALGAEISITASWTSESSGTAVDSTESSSATATLSAGTPTGTGAGTPAINGDTATVTPTATGSMTYPFTATVTGIKDSSSNELTMNPSPAATAYVDVQGLYPYEDGGDSTVSATTSTAVTVAAGADTTLKVNWGKTKDSLTPPSGLNSTGGDNSSPYDWEVTEETETPGTRGVTEETALDLSVASGGLSATIHPTDDAAGKTYEVTCTPVYTNSAITAAGAAATFTVSVAAPTFTATTNETATYILGTASAVNLVATLDKDGDSSLADPSTSNVTWKVEDKDGTEVTLGDVSGTATVSGLTATLPFGGTGKETGLTIDGSPYTVTATYTYDTDKTIDAIFTITVKSEAEPTFTATTGESTDYVLGTPAAVNLVATLDKDGDSSLADPSTSNVTWTVEDKDGTEVTLGDVSGTAAVSGLTATLPFGGTGKETGLTADDSPYTVTATYTYDTDKTLVATFTITVKQPDPTFTPTSGASTTYTLGTAETAVDLVATLDKDGAASMPDPTTSNVVWKVEDKDGTEITLGNVSGTATVSGLTATLPFGGTGKETGLTADGSPYTVTATYTYDTDKTLVATFTITVRAATAAAVDPVDTSTITNPDTSESVPVATPETAVTLEIEQTTNADGDPIEVTTATIPLDLEGDDGSLYPQTEGASKADADWPVIAVQAPNGTIAGDCKWYDLTDDPTGDGTELTADTTDMGTYSTVKLPDEPGVYIYQMSVTDEAGNKTVFTYPMTITGEIAADIPSTGDQPTSGNGTEATPAVYDNGSNVPITAEWEGVLGEPSQAVVYKWELSSGLNGTITPADGKVVSYDDTTAKTTWTDTTSVTLNGVSGTGTVTVTPYAENPATLPTRAAEPQTDLADAAVVYIDSPVAADTLQAVSGGNTVASNVAGAPAATPINVTAGQAAATEVTVQKADGSGSYDTATGGTWSIAANDAGVQLPDLVADNTTASANPLPIQPKPGTPAGTYQLTYTIPGDPANSLTILVRVGSATPTAQSTFNWTNPTLSSLGTGGSLNFVAGGSAADIIAGWTNGIPSRVTGYQVTVSPSGDFEATVSTPNGLAAPVVTVRPTGLVDSTANIILTPLDNNNAPMTSYAITMPVKIIATTAVGTNTNPVVNGSPTAGTLDAATGITTVPVANMGPSDFANGKQPEIGVTPVAGAGVTYNWDIRVKAIGTNQFIPLETPGNGISFYQIPNRAGQYFVTETVKAANGDTIGTYSFGPFVLTGTVETNLTVAGSSNANATVAAGYATNVTVQWNTPNGAAPLTNTVQYIWEITAVAPASSTSTVSLQKVPGSNASFESITVPTPTTGSKYYMTGGPGAETVQVVGLANNDQVTIRCTPIVPDSHTSTSFGTPLAPTSGTPAASSTVTLTGSTIQISNLTPNNVLNGWIGESLDESRTVVWAPVDPANVGHWIMQPVGTNTIGQEIIVTPNESNPNYLTFTTNGPIVGADNAQYQYNLIAYSRDAGTSATQIASYPVTLWIHMRKPHLHDQTAHLTPTVEASNSVAVWGAWWTDARGNVQVQQNNLPSFDIAATMEGGNAGGWAQTQWAVSTQNLSQAWSTSGSSLPYEDWLLAQFANIGQKGNLLSAVSGGASQDGDLTSKYTVQPSEIKSLYDLNAANGTLNTTVQYTNGVGASPLYYYAKVQYGTNANCARVTAAPFQLWLIQDGYQFFSALDADGSVPTTVPPAAPTFSVNTNWNWAEISALYGSNSVTELNTLWIPQQAPQNVGYSWQLQAAPGSVTVEGQGVVSPGSIWTGSQSVKASNFTVQGLYRFICTPTGLPGDANALPVVFEVNVSNLTVTSYEDQAQKFADWIQPASGYFPDTIQGSKFNESTAYPTYKLGSMGSLLTIGNVTGTSVIGDSSVDGTKIPVSVNSRFQLYFDPSGIQYGIKENGEPNYLSADPSSENYWKNYVVLEWRYKTSQYAEDDGNSGVIPQGLGFSGVNSPMLTSGPLSANMDGWQFALEIHDKNDENVYTTTRWVLLDLDGISPATQPEASIASYPAADGSNVNVTVGSDVTLTASVQASIPEEDLTYQWQSRAVVTTENPNPQWANIEGATEQSYTLTSLQAAQNGVEYRCIVTNTAYAGGVMSTSNALKLNVSAADGSIVISAPQTASLINLYASRTLTTEVTARTDNGTPVTYQWFMKRFLGPVPTGNAAADTIDEAAALIAASASIPIEGATGTSMTSEPLQEGVYEFTCRIVNANDPSKVENSAPVYVVVTENSRIPFISKPSAPETGVVSVGVENGKSITLDCTAWIASDPGDGEDITYQWQSATSLNGPWNDVACTTSSLTLNAVTPTYTGAYFRCIATNAKAGESTTSDAYRLNVWNVAEVPTITQSPANQEIVWTGSIPGNEISVTSTITVPQGGDHNTVEPMWITPGGNFTPTTNPILNPPVENWTAPMVSLERTVSGGNVVYTSTLSIPVRTITAARNYSGSYSVVWFNNQYINDDTGANVEVNEVQETDTKFLLAPQAASGTATIDIQISGTPKIVIQPAAQTKAIGETASFSVTALLNENQNENPKGSLVYVWQISEDGGATWRNALSTDGTGQFTDTFTTIPLTQEMYDNSTASNVAGPGTGGGTIGNAKTVYEYRCIVANRATGMKATTTQCTLIITPDAAPVTEPTITPGEGSSITITGTGSSRYATGMTATKDGVSVSDFLDELGYTVPAGYTLRVVNAEGEAVADDAIMCTGYKLELVKDATDEVVDQVTVIMTGDVLGTGVVNIAQVVAMARDLNGVQKLEGVYALAGDFNGNGTIDISDLVAEAHILNETIDIMK